LFPALNAVSLTSPLSFLCRSFIRSQGITAWGRWHIGKRPRQQLPILGERSRVITRRASAGRTERSVSTWASLQTQLSIPWGSLGSGQLRGPTEQLAASRAWSKTKSILRCHQLTHYSRWVGGNRGAKWREEQGRGWHRQHHGGCGETRAVESGWW
jgi:hypothetical protein